MAVRDTIVRLSEVVCAPSRCDHDLIVGVMLLELNPEFFDAGDHRVTKPP